MCRTQLRLIRLETHILMGGVIPATYPSARALSTQARAVGSRPNFEALPERWFILRILAMGGRGCRAVWQPLRMAQFGSRIALWTGASQHQTRYCLFIQPA